MKLKLSNSVCSRCWSGWLSAALLALKISFKSEFRQFVSFATVNLVISVSSSCWLDWSSITSNSSVSSFGSYSHSSIINGFWSVYQAMLLLVMILQFKALVCLLDIQSSLSLIVDLFLLSPATLQAGVRLCRTFLIVHPS